VTGAKPVSDSVWNPDWNGSDNQTPLLCVLGGWEGMPAKLRLQTVLVISQLSQSVLITLVSSTFSNMPINLLNPQSSAISSFFL